MQSSQAIPISSNDFKKGMKSFISSSKVSLMLKSYDNTKIKKNKMHGGICL